MTSPKKNILVLDFDPEFLIALEHLLEGEGFNVTTTWHPREAEALLGSSRLDALLVGEHPPEVKSVDLLKQVRANQMPLPCIVMQAAALHPFEAQYLCALGAYAVIPKWKQKAIVDKLWQSLRHSHGTAKEKAPSQQFSASA